MSATGLLAKAHVEPVIAASGARDEAVLAKDGRRAHQHRMRSSTAKIPKGQSYPLRPSALEEALTSADVAIDVYLTRTPGRVFNAHYWPSSSNVPFDRIYIQAGSVPSDEVSTVRAEFEAYAIPVLVRWIAQIAAADERSSVRRDQQLLTFYEWDDRRGVVS